MVLLNVGVRIVSEDGSGLSLWDGEEDSSVTTSFRVGMAEGIENGGCTVNQILVNSCDSDVMKMAD